METPGYKQQCPAFSSDFLKTLFLHVFFYESRVLNEHLPRLKPCQAGDSSARFTCRSTWEERLSTAGLFPKSHMVKWCDMSSKFSDHNGVWFGIWCLLTSLPSPSLSIPWNFYVLLSQQFWPRCVAIIKLSEFHCYQCWCLVQSGSFASRSQ